jgi:hypothetical protein
MRKLLNLFIKILFDEQGTALSITRVSSGAIATAAGMATRDAQIEAVVNSNIDSDSNIAADGVKAVALNSDVVRTDYGLVQHTDGSLYVDVSDTNPSLELSDGGLRAKVYGLINRTTNGLTWGRTGDMLLSSSTSTPDGFTDVSSTYADKFIRISATALSAGGADTHDHNSGVTGSHTLTEAEMPSHTHNVTYSSNEGDVGYPGSTNGGSSNTYATASAGSGNGHTHTIATGDNVPAYVTLKMYQMS